jgi:hypothetical protein
MAMRYVAAIAVGLMVACSSGEPTSTTGSSPAAVGPSPSSEPTLAPTAPAGAQQTNGGCGATAVYKGGALPGWATINAPSSLPYVVANPGLAVGYIFGYPMKAGLDANTKVLWYVATARDGLPLTAQGHPVGANAPVVKFSKAADSSPGEIYPTGPTVPSAGCWHFILTWHGGDQRADVDLSFQ